MTKHNTNNLEKIEVKPKTDKIEKIEVIKSKMVMHDIFIQTQISGRGFSICFKF